MMFHRSHARTPARLLTALAVMLSMLLASVGSVGAETPIMSSQPLAMAMVAQADMAGEPGHATGGSDCATHCLTAVSRAVGPTDAVPVSRDLSYPILTTDLTGQSGPATARPPRI